MIVGDALEDAEAVSERQRGYARQWRARMRADRLIDGAKAVSD
jgi:hypothetical protein